MLFFKGQCADEWPDSHKRHHSSYSGGSNGGPLAGHYQPCCSHQAHFDQQVHHQCSDQRCDDTALSNNNINRYGNNNVHVNKSRRGGVNTVFSGGLGLCQGLPRAMWTVIALVLVSFLMLSARVQNGPGGAWAHSCAPCDPKLCPDTEDCPGGVVTDICDCCQVCAKMENESCGGSLGFLGKCDRNLQCFVQTQPGQPITGREDGVCKVIPEMMCGNNSACPTAYRHRLCPPDAYLQTVSTDDDNIGSGISTTQETTTGQGVKMLAKTSFCVCNSSACLVPTCALGFVLHLRHNATGVPGDCCDDYTCKRGQECDPIICPPLRDETPCPSDSVRLPNIWTPDRCCEIQQGCTCPASDLCPPARCPAGYKVQVIERASGKPGACCDRFRCIDESGLTCTYGGQQRQNGERWKIGRCRTCVCQDGLNRCRDQVCPEFSCTWMDTPPGECCPVCRGCVSDSGRLYNNSAVWKENECTTCSCVNGHAQCQAEMCAAHCSNPKRVPGQCCPVCPDSEEQQTVRAVCPSLEPCPLSCSQGLEVGADGCPRCQCRKEKCSLVCPFGFQSDVEGNPRCECRPSRERCPTLAEQECGKKCEYGYRTSPEGCIKCRCNKCPHFKCTKRCLNGLMANDEGCPICKCKDVAKLDRPILKKKLTKEVEGRSCMSQSGVYHENGESWDDRCRLCYCHNGKEMCSVISCPAPQCPNPIFRTGDCCPSCPGIALPSPNGEKQLCQAHNGELYVEGETWKMDSCTLCMCHGGNILCETPSCPPVLCHHPIKHENSCCASCKGNDLGLPIPSNIRKKCKVSTGMVYRHGDIWRSTPCQSCVCQDGQFHCYNQMCPVLTCVKTILRKNQCCPTCVDTTEPEVCVSDGDTYNSGESWQGDDNCTECTCSAGNTICHPPICPPLNCSVLIRRKGHCCPECYDSSFFHSEESPNSVNFNNQTVEPEHNNGNLGFVIGLSTTLILVFFLLIVLVILLVYVLRKRKQFPFHNGGNSALDENQGSIPFLPPHTKTVPGDKPYLEKLCSTADRQKNDRITNNYTEFVFGDAGKETAPYGQLMT